MTDDKMTDEEIVAALRSGDAEQIGEALNALDLAPHGTVLLRLADEGTTFTWTKDIDFNRLFIGSLGMTQMLGRNVGLELKLVPDQPQPDKIQVATGLPPMRAMR